ncbi:MAG: hypothetical protein LBQ80_02085 [Clostridium sp.]|jgi:hypothetical protein|nr:hypothetical protein [Clostridium sp.]
MKKNKSFAIALLVLLVFAAVSLGLVVFPNAAGESIFIPGTYNSYYGSQTPWLFRHMSGTTSSGQAIYVDTFCSDFASGAGRGHGYYYWRNNLPTEDIESNPELHDALNELYLSVDSWRHLRYEMLYTNANEWLEGNAWYWAGLQHYAPSKYLNFGNFSFRSDSESTYFGASPTDDFMGLGAIEAGDTIDIGAQSNTQFLYNGQNVTSAVSGGSSPTYPASVVTNSFRIGPFKLVFDPSSDPVLAQLNSGLSKTSLSFIPKFQNEQDASRVRFFLASAPEIPVYSIPLGEAFYVDYNQTSQNMAAAMNGITVPIALQSENNFIFKVIADQIFVGSGQPQTNVEVESGKIEYNFKLRFLSDYVPPEPDVDNGEYSRPTVDKLVTEDNHLNATGEYVDVLETQAGGDVLHKMTVSADEPKGTILVFQDTDYDLPLNKSGVAYVTTAAQLKSAIDANKPIKQMANITIPSSWAASATVYSNIFDGNGFQLVADGGTMGSALFGQTQDAVFYRLQFVNFNIRRTISAANYANTAPVYYGGALADYMSAADSGDYRGRIINCYLRGSISFTVSEGAYSSAMPLFYKRVGGAVGFALLAEVYGLKAEIDFSCLGARDNGVDDAIAAGLADRDAVYANSVAAAGLFGVLYTARFENVDLILDVETKAMKSVGVVWTLGDGSNSGLVVQDIRASISLSNHFLGSDYGSSNRRQGSQVGGFAFEIQNARTIDRVTVDLSYINNADHYLGMFYGMGHLVNSTISSNVVSNSRINISGNVNASYDAANFNKGGDGIYIITGLVGFLGASEGTDADIANTGITIENCEVNASLTGHTWRTAGLYSETAFGWNSCSAPNVVIRNSFFNGTVGSDHYAAGIMTGFARGGRSVLIENCVANVSITGTPYAAGIFIEQRDNLDAGGTTVTASPGPSVIRGCYVAGTITATYKSNIFRNLATSSCHGSNNYTSLSGGTGAATENGMTQALSAGTALSFYKNTLGFSIAADESSIWTLPSGIIPGISEEQTKKCPPQRVYVFDYYHTSTTPISFGEFYVYEGGEFKRLWESELALEGSNSIVTEIDMGAPPSGQSNFVFYWKKPSVQPGTWQNTVKIIPKDDRLDGGALSRDFPRDIDDDWVLAREYAVSLNIVKLTNVDEAPLPLDGTSFRLYYTSRLYDDMTDLGNAYTGWSYEDISPEGYLGAVFACGIVTGSYVLKEIAAPSGYGGNVGRIWYGSFANGSLELYEGDPTMSIQLKRLSLLASEKDEGELVTISYGATITNLPDADIPMARVRVVKWNEDGSEKIDGAKYVLQRFGGEGFTGEAYAYGNNLFCNDPSENFVDLSYGYYQLLEIEPPEGYSLDSTPIYIKYTEADGLVFVKDNHSAGVDRVGYMDGIQDLRANWGLTNESGVQTLTVNTRDKKTEYRLSVEKYLAGAAGNEQKLAGISFELYGTAGDKISSHTTDSSGSIVISLPSENQNYTLKEALTAEQAEAYTAIPDYTIETRDGAIYLSGGAHGYDSVKIERGSYDAYCYVLVKDGAEYTVVRPGDDAFPKDVVMQEEEQTGGNHAYIRVPNERQPQRVVLTKTELGDPERLLAGAVFEVRKTADNSVVKGFVLDSAGKYSYSATAENTSLSTGAGGTLSVTGLPPGSYYFLETAAPPGYVTPSGTAARTSFSVIENGPSLVSVGAENTPTQLELTKLNKDDESESLQGAVFELYKSNGGKLTGFTAQGSFYRYTEGEGASSIATGADGKILIKALPAGSYYFLETVAPTGFALPEGDEAKLPFELSASSSAKLTLTARNTRAGLDFVFTKTDKNENPLEGVRFELYACKTPNVPGHTHSQLAADEESNCWNVAEPYKTAQSGADGRVEFTTVEYGEYMLAEVQALAGYELPKGQWLISVNPAAEGVNISARGEQLPPAFKVVTDGDGGKSYYLPNYAQLVLPKTGGVTALLSTAAGSVLCLAAGLAAIRLARKRRKIHRPLAGLR